MKKTLSLLLLVLVATLSCEKDDICDAATPTTPRLVIDFYNITNPSVKKNVTKLKVIGDGKQDGIVFNASATNESKFLTNASSISIPLKTDANSTKFKFILNFGNTNPALIDTDEITFNYNRKDIFVSRACGFKTVFELAPINPFIQNAVPVTKLKWMQLITIEKNNLDTENETHIKVFF